MAGFTRIEVHFEDRDAGPRRVVIRPGTDVQGIILRGSQEPLEFLSGIGQAIMNPNNLPRGLTIEGALLPRDSAALAIKRGPGDVCYLQGGVLKCWKAD